MKQIFDNLTSRYAKHLVIACLLLITVAGFAVRSWRLETAPKGALIDELHFGYLAHSLLETGKDEHGEAWPIIFRAFGDEKLPAMAYLDIPSVAIFGLSLTAIRIPSVLAGTFLILASYWLLRELRFSRTLSLVGALITALSPWTFFLSRFGFESNIALLCFTVGLAALFRALNTPSRRWFALTGIAFGLTWYSYIAYRPITVALLVVLYGLLLWQKKLTKISLVALLAMVLVIAPLFQPKVVGVNSTRFEQVGVSSGSSLDSVVQENRNFCTTSFPGFLCNVVFNKPLLSLRVVANNYLLSFSPDFLVGEGEGSADFLTVDGYGQFYPIVYPLFVIGIAALFFSKQSKIKLSSTAVVLIWTGFLLSPVATAFVGEPQKVRISAYFPFVLILILLGLASLWQVLQKTTYQRLFLIGLSLVLISHSALYFTEFFGVHTQKNGFKYQSFVPDMVRYVQTLPDDSIINLEPRYSDPLMFYAFYAGVDPRYYQENAVLGELEPGGFQHTVELGNIHAYKDSIHEVGCKGQIAKKDAIFITTSFIPNAPILYEGKSENAVHTEIYAYDADHFIRDLNCLED